MSFLIILFAVVIFVMLAYVLCGFINMNFDVHKDVSHWYCQEYEKSPIITNFKTFKVKFDGVVWGYDSINGGVLYDRKNSNSHIYDGVFEINNICYIMKNGIEFKKTKRYIKKYIKSHNLKRG